MQWELRHRAMAQIPNSTIIEANVAYGGPRSTTPQHRETLAVNGWTFCPVDIIDKELGMGSSQYELISID